MIKNDITTVDTSLIHSPAPADTLYDGRRNVVDALSSQSGADVIILVTAYGRLEKTKQCVESILTYTTDVDYQLVLLDNGSEDQGKTMEYFQSIQLSSKKIVHVTKNVHFLSYLYLDELLPKKYLVSISNDIIVTKNWLSNMLRVFETEKNVGMVCPVSSNISNLQQVNLNFHSMDEMQELAAQFNQSDPRKWQERMRLMMPMAMWSTECLLAFHGKMPLDFGYFHDFGDDDQSFTIRRAGYKLMLAGDTWVHHNHDIWNKEDKDPQEFQKSLEIGRQNFMGKYQGVDAWEDVNNYWLDITPHIPQPKQKEKKRILGIDTKCGTPILDVKNRLRNFEIFDAELSAFTQSAKYVTDLNTICDGIVACDREEFLSDQFLSNYFDYIVVDRPINRYHEPQKVLNDLMRLLKSGGLLMLPLTNTFSFYEYAYCQGICHVFNKEFSYNIPVNALQDALKQFGEIQFCIPRFFNVDKETQEMLFNRLPKELPNTERKECLTRMLINYYFLGVTKI